MITRIERDLFFVAGVHFNGTYMINSYDITLSMLVETDNSREQNVANERIDYFIKTILTNAVFVNQEQSCAIAKYVDAGMEVCTLPEEPYDQVVAMAILLKLNAILEGRMKITDITICSMLSEGIRYPIVSEIAENADIMLGDRWWHKGNVCIRDESTDLLDSSTNIVKLFDDSDWTPIGLTWKEKTKIS